MKESESLALAGHLIEVVPRVMSEIRSRVRAHGAAGLTLAQFRILALLNKKILTNSELADACGVDSTSMSRIVDGLVRKKLVLRSPGLKDRRKVQLKPSSSGQKLYLQVIQSVRGDIEKSIRGLTPEDRKNLELGLSSMEALLVRAGEAS